MKFATTYLNTNTIDMFWRIFYKPPPIHQVWHTDPIINNADYNLLDRGSVIGTESKRDDNFIGALQISEVESLN